MKAFMHIGEFLVGIVVLLITLLCIAVAGVISLIEYPNYRRHAYK